MTQVNHPKPNIIPFEPTHYPGVLSLYKDIFGEKASHLFAKRWHWSQEKNLFPDQTPKWVLLDQDRVVGYLGTVPQAYQLGETSFVGHTPCDFMVHKEYAFYGIKLMQAFFKTCENCVACDDIPATVKVTQFLGAHDRGDVLRYMRLLDARVLKERPRYARLPAIIFSFLTVFIHLRDRFLSAPLKAISYDRFDSLFDIFFQRTSLNETRLSTVKNANFLNWRYGPQSPHADRKIGILKNNDGSLRGYVVFCMTDTAEKMGVIFDLEVMISNDNKAIESLIYYACKELRSMGAWMVRCHALSKNEVLQKSLKHQAFSLRKAKHKWLVKLNNKDIEGHQWKMSYGDNEASHGFN